MAPTSSQQTSERATDLPFAAGLLEPASVQRLAEAHANALPYNYCAIKELLEPSFARDARKDIVEQLAYRAKETDIYKINQSGDLENISGLPAEELALLPNLHRLRDAIYSSEFRNFVREVTGCGPLSGVKSDMACNLYEEGCYLLTHDDVIGTRRISFILYLPCEEPQWQPEWGGALELYPIAPADPANPDRPNIPAAKPTASIPPAFNQFAFFAVTPGYSFHSVEEVVVEGDGQKGGVGTRVSLQGWFHSPVEGEEGYEGPEAPIAQSTLEQLYAMTLSHRIGYLSAPTLPLPLTPMDPSSLPLLNPAYFDTSSLAHLRKQFIDNSHLLLSSFLNPNIASEIETLIRAVELSANVTRRFVSIGGHLTNKIPHHWAGEDPENGWSIVGPPHIQRFLSFAPKTSATGRLEVLLTEILAMFDSDNFRTWLTNLTAVVPLAHASQVRRFRPGLDYTLAKGEPQDGDAILDVGLGLTPIPANEADKSLWEDGDVGGWEMWLVGEEGGDEATYGSGVRKTGEESDDEGTLLALEPAWNTLSLVLRDPGVLKFVKYVAGKAPGSRWDVSGEWEVGQVELEEDSEEEKMEE
ncbi:prolyl 3-hydroxylase /prolyl 3,4-dihydroxylase, partial [Phenoliferia sp. Uapishka_3]